MTELEEDETDRMILELYADGHDPMAIAYALDIDIMHVFSLLMIDMMEFPHEPLRRTLH